MFAQSASHGIGGDPLKWGYACTLTAGSVLPVSRKGSIYMVDGSGTINRLTPLPNGAVVDLHFNAAPTLVHSTLLLLPGSANVTVDAGSVARFISLGNGVWRCAALDTTYGRQLAAAVSASAARTTLGLASVPREVLTANRTYYVRTDGSDSNNGLANTAGGAFLTIQKAIDTAVALDLGIYSVTINVADGTYTGAVVLKAYVGVGPIYITGNTGTPSNVVISTTGASAIAGSSCGTWTIGGVKVQTATAGYGVYIQGGTSIVTLNKVDFGVVGGVYSHIHAALGASITIIGNYTISGNSGNSHYYAIENGVIIIGAVTVTLSGTPTYQRFALAYMAGLIRSAATFSGSGTGVRYLAIKNGSFEVYSAGANYFPGNSAGSADATSSYS